MLTSKQVKEIKNGEGVYVLKQGKTIPYKVADRLQELHEIRSYQARRPKETTGVNKAVHHRQDRSVKREYVGTYTTKSGQEKNKYRTVNTGYKGTILHYV
jgi:hypothetical protein